MYSVTVYSTPNCQQCKMTYRALEAKGIAFEVVEVAENPAALEFITDELGYSRAPVVVVDQEPQNHWSGFRPDLVENLAKANAAA